MSKQQSGSEKGDDYEQTLLTWPDGSRVTGRVTGNTDSGYALISLADGGAAIYHEDFGVLTLDGIRRTACRWH